ncbi:ricin-type beta-trefoil lectin domain protein [Streptomyces sp. NBC_00102]|uniref:glycoside hydrolase family 27 protein n=1 Tax=Streptomyces sp. NBC_00102 TaxID=2975652 RepID=UPI0022530078|nr:ricin-type beta-trefoil lectin domain protein [Streptomyces sp. NBC_00102]MCX5402310.1 ricin-type beta-trefoil lectin domain protein [Streptomyces sp. NBC_00102]
MFDERHRFTHRLAAAAASLTLTAGGLTGAAAVTSGLVLGGQVATVAAAPEAVALENGLARTPQMGFNNWNTTGCGAQFDEAMVKGIADIFVAQGLKAAGYTYVNLDDCWALPSRDAAGNLVPDPVRFPNGIKAVADYVHSKGLKFGLYSSAGTKTCANTGFPGGLGHEQQDADLWAYWGVDYLKYDNCNNTGADAGTRYNTMGDALKATGRPILYSICEWGSNQPWNWAPPIGNSWRTTGDISDSWSSMIQIAHQNQSLAPYAKPGAWNDPDMLEVGNGGMTDTEYRTHFSLWAQMAAPLLIGSDIRTASPATLTILKNTDVIAVDQDPLGKQGTVVSSSGGLVVMSKPLANGDRAVTLTNENASTATVSTTAAAVGLPSASSYKLANLWSKAVSSTGGPISTPVPAHGTVMYRVSPGTGSSTGTTHPLVGASSQRCLDVEGGGTTPGTKIEIWDCNGAGNQAVTLTAAGELRLYGGSQCVDANDNRTAPGTAVQLWTCNGGANQQWTLNPDGTVTGKQSGLCLDVTGGDKPAGNVNGTPLELWTCNAGANQQWSLA